MNILALGNEMVKLAKNAKSVGTFVEETNNNQVMEFLPRFQQACAGVPFNENTYCQSHLSNELNEIDSYDLSFIFQYKQGQDCDVYLEKVTNKIYNVVIETNTIEQLSSFLFHFMCDLMIDNQYLKK